MKRPKSVNQRRTLGEKQLQVLVLLSKSKIGIQDGTKQLEPMVERPRGKIILLLDSLVRRGMATEYGTYYQISPRGLQYLEDLRAQANARDELAQALLSRPRAPDAAYVQYVAQTLVKGDQHD